MVQLNDREKGVLESQPLWHVTTSSDEPDVAMIGFKEILEDGRLLLRDVFRTLAEIFVRTGKSVSWEKSGHEVILNANLATCDFSITAKESGVILIYNTEYLEWRYSLREYG